MEQQIKHPLLALDGRHTDAKVATWFGGDVRAKALAAYDTGTCTVASHVADYHEQQRQELIAEINGQLTTILHKMDVLRNIARTKCNDAVTCKNVAFRRIV